MDVADRRAAERAVALTALGSAGVAAAIEGLSHPNAYVRRGAADFMDHHADDRCVPKLMELALHDPVPFVRRQASHSLGCQKCKPEPLNADTLPLQIEVAKHDPEWKARRAAVWQLSQLNVDLRAMETLRFVAEHDPSPEVRGAARGGIARKQPGPAHRAEAAMRARLAGLARAS